MLSATNLASPLSLVMVCCALLLNCGGSDGDGGTGAPAGAPGSAGASASAGTANNGGAGSGGTSAAGGTTPQGGNAGANFAGESNAGSGGTSGGGNQCEPAVEPDNLVKNGGFKCDVSSWTPLVISLDFKPDDALDDSASGSGFAFTKEPVNAGFAQCVPVTEGKVYAFAAKVKIPTSASQGQAFVSVHWHDREDCISGGFINIDTDRLVLQAKGPFDTWQILSSASTGEPLKAPSGAKTARISGSIVAPKVAPDGIFGAYFDHFEFREAK